MLSLLFIKYMPISPGFFCWLGCSPLERCTPNQKTIINEWGSFLDGHGSTPTLNGVLSLLLIGARPLGIQI